MPLRTAMGDDGRTRDHDEEIGDLDVDGAESLTVNSDTPDGLILFVISGKVVWIEDTASEC